MSAAGTTPQCQGSKVEALVPDTPRRGGSRGFVRTIGVVAVLAVAGSAATGSYTVRRGDTVSHIAERHGVSARSIVVANGLTDPHRVIAGKTLQIPGASAGPAAATGGASYTVRSGDTLSDIALRLGVTTGALARANGLTQPNRLAAGRTLSIPASTGAGPAASGGTQAASSSAPAGLPARLRANPTRLSYIPTFERWAAHYGVSADLLMAMTWLESGWQQGAVSSTGAVGIGQIMPDTTAWMRDHVIGESLDPRSVEDNIRMSARYLRWLLDRTGGDVRLALGGYYQGLASVRTRGLLAETERYVADITTLRSRF